MPDMPTPPDDGLLGDALARLQARFPLEMPVRYSGRVDFTAPDAEDGIVTGWSASGSGVYVDFSDGSGGSKYVDPALLAPRDSDSSTDREALRAEEQTPAAGHERPKRFRQVGYDLSVEIPLNGEDEPTGPRFSECARCHGPIERYTPPGDLFWSHFDHPADEHDAVPVDDKPAMLLTAAAAEQKLALIAAHRGVTDPDWPATPYQARQFAADIRAILQREAF